MRYTGVLLVSDMDGTLLNGQQEISNENAEAVCDFMAQGGRFAYATGRTPHGVSPYFDRITPNAPGICHNGAMIYDYVAKRPLCIRELSREVQPALEQLRRELPEVGIDIDTAQETVFFNRNEATDELCALLGMEAPRRERDFAALAEPWLRVGMWRNPAQIGELEAFWEKTPLPEGVWRLRTHAWSYELISTQADKGLALREYSRLLGGIDTIAAIGDNENDAGMLRFADRSFAPANATQVARDAAQTVLSVGCDESAVAAAIARL